MGLLLAASPTIGTYLGWAASAYSVISWVTAPDQVQPKIDSLKLAPTDYGTPFPFLIGRERIGGSYVWSTDLIPKKHSEPAKGGPNIVSYTYRVSFAVVFTSNEVRALRKLWLDSVLVYDYSDDGGKKSNVASVEGGLNFVFYPGSLTQPIDPTIESYEGVGTTCAYRGRSVLVVTDLLTTKWGNKRPTSITAELITDGDNTATVGEIIHTPNNLPEGVATHSSAIWDGDKARITWWGDGPLAGWPYQGMSLQDWDIDTLLESGYIYSAVNTDPNATHYRMVSDVHGQFKWYEQILRGGYLYPSNAQIRNGFGNQPHGTGNVLRSGNYVYYTIVPDSALFGSPVHLIRQTDYGSGQLQDSGELIFGQNTVSFNGLLTSSPDSRYLAVAHYNGSAFAAGNNVYFIHKDTFSVRGGFTYPVGFVEQIGVWDDVLYIFDATHIKGYAIPDGALVESYEMTVAVRASTYRENHMLSKSIARVRHTLWYIGGSIEAYQVPLSEAITRICAVKDIRPDQIDVSDLTGVMVDGLAISSQGSLIAALRPLAAAYYFDMYHADGKLVFTQGGNAPTIVLTEDDLAKDIVMTPLQEYERPATVTIGYKAYGNDYNKATQEHTEFLLSDEKKAIDLGMVLTDTYAAQLAEITWLIGNYGSTRFEWAVSQHHDNLTPSMVVTQEWEGNTYQIKLDKVDYAPGGMVRLAGTSDREDLYTSWATGGVSGVPATVPGVGLTRFFAVDCPALTVSHDYPGIYVFAWGTIANWAGCTVMRSVDQGQNWQVVGDIIDSATIGITASALTSWTRPIVQAGGFVDVSFNSGTVPSSVTKNAMLAGENTAVVGGDGAWEVLSFQTVTDIGSGVHRLSGLMRGRLGTEQNTAGHTTGQRIMLLDSRGIIRVPLDASNISTPVWLAAVPANKTIDNAIIQVATPIRMGVKPYAPVHLRLYYDGTNGKWMLQYNRRARISGDWVNFMDAPIRDVPESYTIQRHRIGSPLLTQQSSVPGTWLDSVEYGDMFTVQQESPDVGLGDLATLLVGTCRFGWRYPQDIGDLILRHDMNKLSIPSSPIPGYRMEDTSSNSNDGVATSGMAVSLDGVADNITFPAIGNIKSISLTVNLNSTTEKVIDLNGTESLEVVAGTVTLNGTWAGNIIYVDGAAAATIGAGAWQRITVTVTSAINVSAAVLGKIGATYGQIGACNMKMWATVLDATDAWWDYANPEDYAFNRSGTSLIAADLDGNWMFNDNLSNTDIDSVFDTSGSQFHGTNVGGSGTWITGQLELSSQLGISGYSRKFVTDGTNAYDLHRTVSGFEAGSSAGSIQFSFSTISTLTWRYVFASGDEGGTYRWGVGVHAGKVFIVAYNAGSSDRLYVNQNYNDGKVHDVVITSSGTAWTITIDGVSKTWTVSSGSDNGNWFSDIPNRDNITIGCTKSASHFGWFAGIIHTVKILNASAVLVAHWRNSGRMVWKDLTGNGYAIAQTGTPPAVLVAEGSTAGQDGLGFTLSDPRDQELFNCAGVGFVQVDDHASIDVVGNFTVSLWLNLYDITAPSQIMRKKDTWNAAYGFYIHWDGPAGKFSVVGSGANIVFTSSHAPVNDEWAQYTFVFDGTSVIVYKNMALVSTSGSVDSVAASAIDLFVGASHVGWAPVAGKIDGVLLYDESLPVEGVECLFNLRRSTYGV